MNHIIAGRNFTSCTYVAHMPWHIQAWGVIEDRIGDSGGSSPAFIGVRQLVPDIFHDQSARCLVKVIHGGDK